MTYLVLARKWRPRSFDTLVGQDHVVRALTHALDTQRLHHAWLFTGTRGVGKTTLSRILAKSLNCEQGITAKPCGVCRACTEIDAGRYVDYVELDAASNRGVDEMTQLLEQAVYAPSSARFKVYMIDEVHMLTGHAFNAMLKTLEEPPPHVKFILATTDPQKIPVTVLSRCLQFNLKHMTVDAIVEHLQWVLAEEGLAFEAPALRLIGQAAGGSMRDALSLTDQAIAYSAANLTLDAVQGMLGTIDQRHLVRLLHALVRRRADDVLAVADELASRGLSYAGALADLAVLLSHIAIEQRVPGVLAQDDPLAVDVASLASTLHPDLVQLYYSIAVHSRSELALAPDEYAGFVMACLRMLSLTPESPDLPEPPPTKADPEREAPSAQAHRADSAAPTSPVASAVLSVEAAEHDIPAWEDVPEAHAAPQDDVQQVEAERSARDVAVEQPDTASPDTPITDGPSSDTTSSKVQPPTAATSDAASQEIPSAEFLSPDVLSSDIPSSDIPLPDILSSDVPPEAFADASDDSNWEPVIGDGAFDADQLPPLALPTEPAKTQRAPKLARMTAQDWPDLAAALPLTGLAAELARQSEWVGVEDGCITLRVAIHSLAAVQGQARLRTVLTEHFGKVVKLAIEFGATGSGTARAVEKVRQAERLKEAENAVENDAFVRSLIEEFGARVIPGSIAALDGQRVA